MYASTEAPKELKNRAIIHPVVQQQNQANPKSIILDNRNRIGPPKISSGVESGLGNASVEGVIQMAGHRKMWFPEKKDYLIKQMELSEWEEYQSYGRNDALFQINELSEADIDSFQGTKLGEQLEEAKNEEGSENYKLVKMDKGSGNATGTIYQHAKKFSDAMDKKNHGTLILVKDFKLGITTVPLPGFGKPIDSKRISVVKKFFRDKRDWLISGKYGFRDSDNKTAQGTGCKNLINKIGKKMNLEEGKLGFEINGKTLKEKLQDDIEKVEAFLVGLTGRTFIGASVLLTIVATPNNGVKGAIRLIDIANPVSLEGKEGGDLERFMKIREGVLHGVRNIKKGVINNGSLTPF